MIKIIITFCLMTITAITAFGEDSTKYTDCDSIAGINLILKSGTVILLGEIHGTNEAPATTGTLACMALKKKLSVTVALEIPIENQTNVDRYLLSEGTDNDFKSHISGHFFLHEYQDGRASQAMTDLIETLRVTKKEHGDKIRIIYIDDQSSSLGRDKFMAEQIKKEIEKSPERIIISLTGNVHSQLSQGSHFSDAYEPMGYILSQIIGNTIVSLDLVYESGTAWVCAGGGKCGVMSLAGEDDGSGCEIFDDEESTLRSGIIYLGEISASRPARERLGK